MKLLAEFSDKNWKKQGIKKLLLFIVHYKNCRLSSIKLTAFVQFIISQAIVATHSGFVVKYNNCFVVNFISNSML
jgi:hypothetical protein